MQIPILDTCEYDTSYTPLKLSILHPIISYWIHLVFWSTTRSAGNYTYAYRDCAKFLMSYTRVFRRVI